MSLGKDLASIRKNQNLTLEDIQNAVKIPLNTLESIEDDSIFSDPEMNKTYVRSFVRSYAKVLKIPDEEIVQALDEAEEGSYTGSLIGDSAQDISETEFKLDPKDTLPDEGQKDVEPGIQDTAMEPEQPKQTPPPPKEDPINWADMGRKFSTASKNSRIWFFALILLIVVALGTTGYLFWDDLGSLFESEPEQTEQTAAEQPEENIIPPTPVDSLVVTENDETQPEETPVFENEEEAETPSGPIQLGDTLTVTVYAAYGQLEPVRITSDLNWRTNPFWMEEGESYYFDFQDTLLVRGQYSRLLLLFNGHVIENPRQNYFNTAFNSIMITRDILDQPNYLAPPPRDFPLNVGAPDSTQYRIRF